MANLYVCGHCKTRAQTRRGHGSECPQRRAGRGDWDVCIEGSARITYDGAVYTDATTYSDNCGFGSSYSDGGSCGGGE